jgi:MFS transporter, DHA1 family, tetracycline resistance protein
VDRSIVTAPPRHAPRVLLEAWFAPFALINGSAVGLVPILLPVIAVRYGVAHVGLVIGAFNLGAFAAPLTGALADKFRAYRTLTIVCAAISAVTLWLFPLAGPAPQLVLALANGAGFAGAMTIANLMIVERRPKSEWNRRLGWLEMALGVGQGCALLVAAWLSTLSAKNALLIGALIPAAAIPLAAFLIHRTAGPARATGPTQATGSAQATGPTQAAGPAQAAGPEASSRPVLDASPHRLGHLGLVGEWGPASPSRLHHPRWSRPSFSGIRKILRGGFGWVLAAWAAAYAGAAVIFALYPVLFQHAFGVAPHTSAVAFAVIVFVSLPLFVLAGRISQRRGPVTLICGAMGARVILLGLLAVLGAVGHVPSFIPLAAFAGIMFAWSFLSVAAPALTARLAPEAEGDAQGMLNATSGIAGLIGSVGGGEVASAWGYPAALAMGAAAVAVGLIIFLTRVAGHVSR